MCFISSTKKPKKHPEVAMRPKPSPRLTIFDEEVDPDAGLFSSDKKVSPRRPLETTQDREYCVVPAIGLVLGELCVPEQVGLILVLQISPWCPSCLVSPQAAAFGDYIFTRNVLQRRE